MLLALLGLLAVAFLVTRLSVPRTRVEALLTFMVVLTTALVALGYLLSACHALALPGGWALSAGLLLILVTVPILLLPHARRRCFRPLGSLADIEARLRACNLRSYAGRLLLMAGSTVGIVTLLSFVIVLTLAPATPDAHAYHLARMAYYLQHGDLGYYDAGYWAQVIYPKVATLLQLFCYLLGGREDSLTQLPQLSAYLVCLLASYGTARHLGATRKAAVFGGLLFGLLTICIAEAATAQNDLILTAYTAVAVYYLAAYRERREVRLLVLAALSLALAVGVKATILPMLPSLAVIAGYALWPATPEGRAQALRHAGVLLLALVVGLVLLTAPAGYADNISRFGDPFGPREARQAYTSEGLPLGTALRDGGLNLLRYGVDFLSCDGLLPLDSLQAQHGRLRSTLRVPFKRLGIDLEAPEGAKAPFLFSYGRPLAANENTSSWGLLGFLWLWPVVLGALFLGRARSATATAARVFAVAAILPVVLSAFLVPYDLFHERFFITAAIFAVPVLALCEFPAKSAPVRAYLVVVLVLGCFSALCSVTFRKGTVLLPFPHNGVLLQPPFMAGHTAQLLREAPTMLPYRMEALVPATAVVAIDVGKPFPEYLLFGEGLTRKLISIHSFLGERRPIPPEAQFLVVQESSPNHRPDDVLLTEPDFPFGRIYLRTLAAPAARQ
jgi:4-amino-4-deoxy-L-arabinose transferase-like glycosyltransferase